MDLDGSGAIDGDELKMLLQTLGEKITPARVEALLAEVDLDGSGEIDFDEFVAMMCAIREGSGASATFARMTNQLTKVTPKFFSDVQFGMRQFKRGERGGLGGADGADGEAAAPSPTARKKKRPHGNFCVCGCRRVPMRDRGRRVASIFPKVDRIEIQR